MRLTASFNISSNISCLGIRRTFKAFERHFDFRAVNIPLTIVIVKNMENTSKEHIEGMERGVADARVADYGEVSSGMESDSDNGVNLGPIPSEGQDDDEDHDAAICAMEAVLRKARRKVLKHKSKGSSGVKKNPKKQVKPSPSVVNRLTSNKHRT